jgi:adenylate kinase
VDILLLGAQGSGKGTQAEILVTELGLPHIASGDLVREAIAHGTPAGQRAKVYNDRGDLVPDEIIVAMFIERLSKPDCAKGAILDGFPRTLAQAEALDQALDPLGRVVDPVIYLKADEEVLVKRLATRYICRAHQHPYNTITNPPKQEGICDIDGSELYQREDDTEAAVRRRLAIFFRETIKLIDYYKNHPRHASRVIEINAEQAINAVTRDILQELKNV